MNWSGGAYLQNAGGLQELEFQRRRQEMEERKKNSLKYQISHGVGGALKGAVSGGLKGALIGTILAPGVGTVAGATLGAGSGALSGGGVLSGAEQKSLASNLATTALSRGMSSYANRMPYGQADVMSEYARGNLKPEDLEMLRRNGQLYGTGPAYLYQ